jgi:hypothetical protein
MLLLFLCLRERKIPKRSSTLPIEKVFLLISEREQEARQQTPGVIERYVARVGVRFRSGREDRVGG